MDIPRYGKKGLLFNSLGENRRKKKWGRGQKVVAYSDTVNDDTMISPTIIVYDKYKGDFFNILEKNRR